MTALHYAATHDDALMAEALLRGGARVDAQLFVLEFTPLHCAALHNSRAQTCMPLPTGATRLCTSPRKTGRWNVAAQLLAADADACARNGVGMAPAECAADLGWPLVAALLADAAAAAERWRGLRRAALTTWCTGVNA